MSAGWTPGPSPALEAWTGSPVRPVILGTKPIGRSLHVGVIHRVGFDRLFFAGAHHSAEEWSQQTLNRLLELLGRLDRLELGENATATAPTGSRSLVSFRP